jgi:hypothetical protein
MLWRVQLGINSTSDVWKFRQNWTSRRGAEFQMQPFKPGNPTFRKFRQLICKLSKIWQVVKHKLGFE